MNQGKRYILSFFLCSTILITRSYERLKHAQIWGEDGNRCLEGVTSNGLKGAFDLMDGYFFVGERLLAFLIHGFSPLELLPFWIGGVCIVIASSVFSCFSLNSYRWVVERDETRVIASMLFCFAPGLSEILGNLANIHIYGFLFLSLLALKPCDEHLRSWEVLLAVLAIFSMGTFVVLIPVFVVRLYRRLNKGDGIILLAMGIATFVILKEREPSPLEIGKVAGYIPTLLIPYAIRGLLFQPWFGDYLTTQLNNPHIKFWQGVVAVLLLGITSKLLWHRRHEKGTGFFLLVVFSVAAWPLLGWMNRPLSVPRFVGVPLQFWVDRYSFYLGFFSILFWFWIIGKSEFRKPILFVFCISQLVVNSYRFLVPRYSLEDVWGKSIVAIKAAKVQGACTKVIVPGIPKEFSWKYSTCREN